MTPGVTGQAAAAGSGVEGRVAWASLGAVTPQLRLGMLGRLLHFICGPVPNPSAPFWMHRHCRRRPVSASLVPDEYLQVSRLAHSGQPHLRDHPQVRYPCRPRQGLPSTLGCSLLPGTQLLPVWVQVQLTWTDHQPPLLQVMS